MDGRRTLNRRETKTAVHSIGGLCIEIVAGSSGPFQSAGVNSPSSVWRPLLESHLHRASVEGLHVNRRRYLLLILLLVPALFGCVRRRLTVRSNPPGALVLIDGQEIGRTPVATPFTYYGTRNFRLMKDGYETVSLNQKFSAPWYQIPGIDFVSENLIAKEIRDERVVDFELVPKANVSMDDVLTRAEQLRAEVQPVPSAGVFDGAPAGPMGPWMSQ